MARRYILVLSQRARMASPFPIKPDTGIFWAGSIKTAMRSIKFSRMAREDDKLFG